jgi:hypothetical protein
LSAEHNRDIVVSETRHLSRWLLVAGAMLIAQPLALFAVHPSLVKAAAVAVAALVTSLMLRGSRFAWTVALVGAGGRLISAVVSSGQYWDLASGIIVICLLSPPSIRFIWTQRPHRRVAGWELALKRPYEAVKASAYGALYQVAEWEGGGSETVSSRKRRSYRLLIWRLGVGCVLLLVLVGVTYNWQHDTGGEAPVVRIIASVTWTCYALVQLAFIAVSILALYKHFTSRGPQSSSRSVSK